MANNKHIQTSISPWLSLRGSKQAVAFYKSAFGAEEKYRLEDPDGNLVARLSVDGAEFWLSEKSPGSPDIPQGADVPVRMILTVADPDTLFARALKAGAKEIFPVAEGYGWRVGRLEDPFGHHWEIGRPLD